MFLIQIYFSNVKPIIYYISAACYLKLRFCCPNIKTSSRHTFKTSSRRPQRNNFLPPKTSSRRLQDVFKMSSEMSWKRLQDVFKTYLQDVFKTFSRRLEDVLKDEKLLSWRCVEDIFKTCVEDFFKTCLEDVFKTFWRPANVCCEVTWEWWFAKIVL